MIANYLKDEKPRIDFFTSGGTLKKSYLLPFKDWTIDRPAVKITGPYLMHADYTEVGFAVYKIL